MKSYKWTLEIETDAEDDIEAQARIEESLEAMIIDPDGPYSFGKLEITKEEVNDD